jgi:hypothetical protein
VPCLDELRRHPVVAVDVNHGHLAMAAVAPDGNVLGTPVTIPLDLAGRPASTRDGRLRAAISALIAAARKHGARAIVIENLDFAAARAEGRERAGTRPSRGRRGRAFRRMAAGIPTGKFRGRLGQQAAHDRSGPPASHDKVPLVQQERSRALTTRWRPCAHHALGLTGRRLGRAGRISAVPAPFQAGRHDGYQTGAPDIAGHPARRSNTCRDSWISMTT